MKEYDERYAEFLEAAQSLFFSKGYEPTSVQEIITMVGVAKGTFYHYFDSKVDILEALVKRMYTETIEALTPMVASDEFNAIEKLESVFAHISQWKAANKGLMLDTARVFYQDDNVLLREKMFVEASKTIVPLLAQIIEQGVAEGHFDVEHAHETAEIILMMPRVLSTALIPLLLYGEGGVEEVQHVKRQIRVYNQSVERVLGMKHGALTIIDVRDLDQWLIDPK